MRRVVIQHPRSRTRNSVCRSIASFAMFYLFIDLVVFPPSKPKVAIYFTPVDDDQNFLDAVTRMVEQAPSPIIPCVSFKYNISQFFQLSPVKRLFVARNFRTIELHDFLNQLLVHNQSVYYIYDSLTAQSGTHTTNRSIDLHHDLVVYTQVRIEALEQSISLIFREIDSRS